MRINKNNKQKGGGVWADVLPIIGIFVLAFVLWVYGGGPNGEKRFSGGVQLGSMIPAISETTGSGSEIKPGEAPTDSVETVVVAGVTYFKSPFYKKIRLRSGSARYEYQPNKEYVGLSSSFLNKEPINITGFILENGDRNELQKFGGGFFHINSKQVVIPNGSSLLLGVDNEISGPILLNPGDEAILMTGFPPDRLDVPLAGSFRVNMCTGYLENEDNRRIFTPAVRNSCPLAESEVGDALLEDKCVLMLSRLGRCEIPDNDPYRDFSGDLVRKHLDGVTGLSSQCHDFVAGNINYYGCVANHLGEKDFLKNEWRIYLNQHFELWGEDREVITLYDSQGRLVDQISY